MKKFTLKRAERLTGRKIFGDLMINGKLMVHFPFRIHWKQYPLAGKCPVQVGFSVPKKLLKKASARNLLRRRMKEAYRKNKYILYEPVQSGNHQLSVLLIYTADEVISYQVLEEKIIVTLKKLSSAYEESL
ncbi:MAG: ribonuclease P protein component [Bacteroidales bacterium]|nr:MAG: ribonuclease P protein component [Bacteroidales bacterium]